VAIAAVVTRTVGARHMSPKKTMNGTETKIMSDPLTKDSKINETLDRNRDERFVGKELVSSKQRLLALVADLDQATNRMIVGTWSVQGVANTLRHIANGLPDETTESQK
jgi:hypothetical protein